MKTIELAEKAAEVFRGLGVIADDPIPGFFDLHPEVKTALLRGVEAWLESGADEGLKVFTSTLDSLGWVNGRYSVENKHILFASPVNIGADLFWTAGSYVLREVV